MRFIAPVRLHLGGAELVALLRRRRHQHRLAVGGADEMTVAWVARVRHQDLIAGLDQREAGQLQGSRGTRGDDDPAGRHRHSEALRVPAADALAQAIQPGGLRVLRRAVPHSAQCRLLNQRRRGEVWLTDVQEDHRPIAIGNFARQPGSGLGHFQHIKRLDALGPDGGAHHRAFPAALSASTSALRNLGASPFRTALTYLCPSVPPNSLASSMHSLSVTRHGTSAQCRNS